MPTGWNWYKRDLRNIKAIAKRFGNVKIKSFPTFSTLDFIVFEFIHQIHWISFLDFFPYTKLGALNDLEKGYRYRRYPFKHYESVFTRFYQGYLLPYKFGVDKRLLHLGTLVASGQMTREEAIEGLNGIPYPSQYDLESDITYFLKKMGWSNMDLEAYILRPAIPHDNYASETRFIRFFSRFISLEFISSLKKWLQR